MPFSCQVYKLDEQSHLICNKKKVRTPTAIGHQTYHHSNNFCIDHVVQMPKEILKKESILTWCSEVASSHASPKPATRKGDSVPLLMPLSCPPPETIGRRLDLRSDLIYNAPIPCGPYTSFPEKLARSIPRFLKLKATLPKAFEKSQCKTALLFLQSSAISLIGCMVPETPFNAANVTRNAPCLIFFSSLAMSTWPSSSNGIVLIENPLVFRYSQLSCVPLESIPEFKSTLFSLR
ncbi:hypothetical protein AX774_g7158 [Zancudomyces culisetae]|uniref:Uncharacterized protein n=1 Tax=Zancudomyces culisetae TaxID=1213189 RepID=A0A1R1PEJ5_ZANCU|nr:hypothetical protein AX774_g7158 [Zancudomyces culisetae]|eukprot:OMH79425.1 hypothetical protein AX774_g7158 [Zancudomyces culisetae]